MPQPADPEHGDDIARTRAGVSQGVEGRDPRAQQRRRLDRRQVIRKSRHGADWSDHVLAVSAVEGDASDLLRLARKQISAPAGIATPAVSAVPADSNALAWRPSGHSIADGIDGAGDLVPENARVLNPRPQAFLHEGIAVTYAARRDFDSDSSRRGLRYWPLDHFKRSLRTCKLCNTHCGHSQLLML